jgi:ribosomal protein S18 acetylase RimI-like enzyme
VAELPVAWSRHEISAVNIEYRDHLSDVDWTALKAALAADNFDNGRSPEQLQRSFENTHAVCIACGEGGVVGTARVLSDGVCNAYLVDLWTLSSLRRQGIARAMIARLLDRLPGQHVYLQADDDLIEFYRRVGFVEQPSGMSRVVGRWLANEPRKPPATTVDQSLRDRISNAVTEALQPLPTVFAGCEGGSAAFGTVDAYSDIDLEYIVGDEASFDDLYAVAERAIEAVSPITASHTPPSGVGRYYKLKEGGDFFLVDLIFFRAGEPDHHLDIERHGEKLPLFDKGDWLRAKPLDESLLAARRDRRYRELQAWFSINQLFVRKAILRGQHVEAVNAFWACTLKPLADLLRMRYCPARWDFGVRYLDRDLPAAVYVHFRDLAFVSDLRDVEVKWAKATAWGAALLRELDSV